MRSLAFALAVVVGLGAVAAIASMVIPSAREAFGRDPVAIAIALLMPGVAALIGIANGARRLVILSWVLPLGLVSVAAALTAGPLSWLLTALAVAAYLAMIFVPGAGEWWTRVVLRR